MSFSSAQAALELLRGSGREEILQELCGYAGKVLDSQYALAVPSRNGEAAGGKAFWQAPGAAPAGLDFDAGLAAGLLRGPLENTCVRAAHLDADPLIALLAPGEGSLAFVGVPVAGADGVFGALCAVGKAGGGEFSAGDEADAALLAACAGEASQRARRQASMEAMERKLEWQGAELRAAREELDSFTYAASHDLRASLRAIIGFAGILREDHSALLSDEGRECLRVIDENGRQMARCMDGFAEVLGVSRRPLALEWLAPAAAAREALQDLRLAQTGGTAEIRIHEMPECRADPVLLRELFRLLLSNALKFTRGNPAGTVEVGCRREDERRTEYYVTDNGVGFDPRYAGRLFGPFQRLHGSAEFEGLGLGLAMARRIVLRHGGRIRAEAGPGRGACFYFTLGDGYSPAGAEG